MWNSTTLLRDAFMGNLTTFRALQFRAGMSDEQTARALLVSPETVRRWRSDRKPNPTALRLMAILAGYVPWPHWDGWEVHNGALFPPGFNRHGFEPGHLYALPYTFAQRREFRRLAETEREQRKALEAEVEILRRQITAISARSGTAS